MATTYVRSSTQLYVDDNLDIKSKKLVSVAQGTASTDGVNLGQMETAIANAGVGVGNSLHVPVADLAAAKAVLSAGRADKMLMLIETIGLYRYDSESLAVSDDNYVIRPTDVASDAVAGRWVKISSSITDHNLMNNKQGGTTDQYYHLTLAELNKLSGIADGATANAKATGAEIDTGTDDAKFATAKAIRDSGLISTAKADEYETAANLTSIADADLFLIEDASETIKNTKKNIKWSDLKTSLTTAFNSLFWKKTATGDVTISVGDVTTITNEAVTNAKMYRIPGLTIKGNNNAQENIPLDLTVAEVKTMLGITNLTRIYRATPTGTINGSNTDFVISATVVSGSEEVFLNGRLMNAGADNDYVIISYGVGSMTIRFLTAPEATPFVDVILVNYSISS